VKQGLKLKLKNYFNYDVFSQVFNIILNFNDNHLQKRKITGLI